MKNNGSAPSSAYPLAWPAGRPRAAYREKSQFKVTLGKAINELRCEVGRLGGSGLVISSNQPLRIDGAPRSDRGPTGDPGVAVYFTYKKKPMSFACDRWETVAGNMRAIERTINALRGIERWGSGAMVEQAFTGFAALPSPEQPWQVLEVRFDASPAEIEAAYKRLAARYHPDKPTGDSDTMARINAAHDRLLEQLAG